VFDHAHTQGICDALALFQIKQGGWLGNTVRQVAVGEAPRVFSEGLRTFQPGGALHHTNVLWPKHLMGRLGTLATLPMLPSMVRQDSNEGTASRALGGLGGLAGMMYGSTAGGLLGAPVGMALGKSIGHGLGHLLGSRPPNPESFQ
jgi:hypothetical protein